VISVRRGGCLPVSVVLCEHQKPTCSCNPSSERRGDVPTATDCDGVETRCHGAFVALPMQFNLRTPEVCAPADGTEHRGRGPGTRACGYPRAQGVALEFSWLFTHAAWIPGVWSVVAGHDGPVTGSTVLAVAEVQRLRSRGLSGGQRLGRKNASMSAALLPGVGFGSSRDVEGEQYLAAGNAASGMDSEI